MKIAVLNAWCNGSTGKIISEIAKAGDKQGFKSFLLYGRGSSPFVGNSKNVNSKINFYADVAVSRLLDNQGRNSICSTSSVIKELEMYSPDILHLHNLHGYWLNYPILVKYIIKKDIPVVWTLHDCWAITGHCAYFEYLQCRNRNNGCRDCPGTSFYPKALIDRAAKGLIEKKKCFSRLNKAIVVTPSKWLGKLVKNSYLAKYPTRVINNGISKDIFHPTDFDYLYQKYNIEKDKRTILYVAMNTNDPWKGFKYILELRDQLTEEYQILVVGNCDVESKERFVSIGRTKDQKELAAFYSMADVLINPSLDDNYPTVNLEALACGLPIVAFPTGGIPEQVNSDVGYICSEKTTDALIKGVKYVTQKDRNNIRKKCIDHFNSINVENIGKQYFGIYKELLGLEN